MRNINYKHLIKFQRNLDFHLRVEYKHLKLQLFKKTTTYGSSFNIVLNDKIT